MPGIVQDDRRVRVIAQEDGHEGGDELMTQGVPGGADLQERQHQHVWAVLDGEAEKLLHLFIMPNFREAQKALHKVQALPVDQSGRRYKTIKD